MPRLQVKDLPLYNAFISCSKSRPTSGFGGICAIPISEVLAYCSLVGIAIPSQRVKYLQVIQELDQAYIEAWSEKQPK